MIQWGTAVTGIDPSGEGVTVHTARGQWRGDRAVVCVGHDLDYLYPDLSESYEITRCALQMALAPAPATFTTPAAILTGTSMTRYGGFTKQPSYEDVRAEIADASPELIEMVANVMFARRPDGTVLLGDSHVYRDTMPPFLEDGITDRLVAEISRVLGAPLAVTQRWQGIYASSSKTSLVMHDQHERVRCISVTSGIGMTLSFGIAATTLDEVAGPVMSYGEPEFAGA